MWDTKRRLLIIADLTIYISISCGYVRIDRIIDKDDESKRYNTVIEIECMHENIPR